MSTDGSEMLQELNTELRFYVYVYIDPRNDEPFYIGKGCGDRDIEHLRQWSLLKPLPLYRRINKILALGCTPTLRRLHEGLAESEAHTYESLFILAIGRRNDPDNPGPLWNLTNGGEGCSGRVLTEESRSNACTAAQKRSANPSWQQKNAEALKLLHNDPEWRQKILQANQRLAANPEWQQKNRKVGQRNAADPDWRQKHKEGVQRRSTNSEWRQKNKDVIQKLASDSYMKGPRTSTFKGVGPFRKLFRARLKYNGKDYYLGLHTTPEQAARVRDAVARILYEGQCYVNFPYPDEGWELEFMSEP